MVDEGGKIPKYQSFGILTKQNNTEPNLILVEAIRVPSCMFNFPLFIVFFVTFFSICLSYCNFLVLKRNFEKNRVIKNFGGVFDDFSSCSGSETKQDSSILSSLGAHGPQNQKVRTWAPFQSDLRNFDSVF